MKKTSQLPNLKAYHRQNMSQSRDIHLYLHVVQNLKSKRFRIYGFEYRLKLSICLKRLEERVQNVVIK